MRWTVTEQFERSIAKLDRKQRDVVYKAIAKFEKNPQLPGLRLEKLGGFENLWSIRGSLELRLLLSRSEDADGLLWIFEDAGPHNVYERAKRI